ncbi:MAG: hypothetical protein EPN97_09155 [Alphaproteobacteria bacterium]|nr:MAG: hypothetical protein EPN97_09155 [Alphaproteobacteria bacterium]
MLNDLKNFAKNKIHLSDKQLSAATKLARGAEIWCASGVLFWGIPVALGLGALGLQALGVGIPAIIGVSTIAFGAAMAGKSLVLQQVFRALHKKGKSALENRAAKAEPMGPTGPKIALVARPAPAAKPSPASVLRNTFNEKVSVEKLVEYFRELREKKPATLSNSVPGNPRPG